MLCIRFYKSYLCRSRVVLAILIGFVCVLPSKMPFYVVITIKVKFFGKSSQKIWLSQIK